MNNTGMYANGRYAAQNPTYHVEHGAWKAAQVRRMLARHAMEVRTVCEIGCGAGETLRQLQLAMAEHTRFYGYDISPHAIERCRQRENERLRFYHGNLAAMETEQFDLLLCLDVVEHVEDYMGFLRKLRGKAAHTIFHIPLEFGVYMVLRPGALLKARRKVGHLHSFTKESALATLEDTGYAILDWFYTPSAIDNPFNRLRRIIRHPQRLLTWASPDWSVRLLGGYELLVLTESSAGSGDHSGKFFGNSI